MEWSRVCSPVDPTASSKVDVVELDSNYLQIGSVCNLNGRYMRKKEVPFVLYAYQEVGQISVDIEELKCVFLAATSRKFLRGPRDMGFLYQSDHVLEENKSLFYPATH